jgi:hypothetical protein
LAKNPVSRREGKGEIVPNDYLFFTRSGMRFERKTKVPTGVERRCNCP